MKKRILTATIVFAILALFAIAIAAQRLSIYPDSFIEHLSMMQSSDGMAVLPVSEIASISLLSPNSKDAPQNLTDDELEQLKKLLEPVELKGEVNDPSKIPDGSLGRSFQITLNSGEEFTFIVCSAIYTIITPEVYKCYYNAEQFSVCASIENLYADLLEKYFPERIKIYA